MAIPQHSPELFPFAVRGLLLAPCAGGRRYGNDTKKPGVSAGLSKYVGENGNGLRRLFLYHLVVAFRLAFGRLRTTAGSLGERGLDLLDRFGLGDALHRRDLAREAIERSLIELPLGIGLLRLRVRAEQVAHHLGDRDDVARIDLGLVLLRAARPHGALDTGTALERLYRPLDQRRLGQLAHADGHDLRGRDPSRHLVLDEVDDEELELGARDLLFLDRHDLAYAVGRIDDELVGLETLALGRLLAAHSRGSSFVRLAADGCLGHGGSTTRRRAGSLRCPPAVAG